MKIVHIVCLLVALCFPSIASAMDQEKHIATTVSYAETDSVRITAYDNFIHIQNAPIGSTLEVYSVVGIKVKEIKLKEQDGEYPVNIPRGYYIARIGETVRKIVIR